MYRPLMEPLHEGTLDPLLQFLQRLTCLISIRNDLGLRGNIFKMLHKAHNALENQFLLRVTIFPSKPSKELWFENVAVQSQVISYTNKTCKML